MNETLWKIWGFRVQTKNRKDFEKMEKILSNRFWLKTLPKLKRIHTVSGCIELYEIAQDFQNSVKVTFETERNLLIMIADALENCINANGYFDVNETSCFIALDMLREELANADNSPKVRKA